MASEKGDLGKSENTNVLRGRILILIWGTACSNFQSNLADSQKSIVESLI